MNQNKQVAWGFQERWSRSGTSWADAGLLIPALVIQITLIQVSSRSRINTYYKYKYQLIQITLILFNIGWYRINTNHYKLIQISTDQTKQLNTQSQSITDWYRTWSCGSTMIQKPGRLTHMGQCDKSQDDWICPNMVSYLLNQYKQSHSKTCIEGTNFDLRLKELPQNMINKFISFDLKLSSFIW